MLMDQFGARGAVGLQPLFETGDIQGMLNDVNKGLVLTEASTKAAFAYEIELKNLQDEFQGLEVSAGQHLLPG